MVRPQDTLYSIAWRHDVDYRDLARWNNIGGDYRITVGQVLMLGPHPGAHPTPAPAVARQIVTPPPGTSQSGASQSVAPQVGKPRPLPESKAPPNGAAAAGAAANSTSAATPAAATAATPSGGLPAPPPGNEAALKWVWPTERMGAPRPVPGGGILLSGKEGQDVRAASAGRVVYSGNGLRGYGNLIIIKHADAVLSAYAHNREMMVHDGEDVRTGQVIAHMGDGPNKVPVLYFEIRRNGKPVDPLPFLSKSK